MKYELKRVTPGEFGIAKKYKWAVLVYNNEKLIAVYLYTKKSGTTIFFS